MSFTDQNDVSQAFINHELHFLQKTMQADALGPPGAWNLQNHCVCMVIWLTLILFENRGYVLEYWSTISADVKYCKTCTETGVKRCPTINFCPRAPKQVNLALQGTNCWRVLTSHFKINCRQTLSCFNSETGSAAADWLQSDLVGFCTVWGKVI